MRVRAARALLRTLFRRVVAVRPPDITISIGDGKTDHIRRWWLIRKNNWFNAYLHHIVHDDDDRAYHDHPWVNGSLVLSGCYDEHTIAAGGVRGLRRVGEGMLVLRRAKTAHRLTLPGGRPCWSLFITGPEFRIWGFHCPKTGWRSSRDYRRKGGCE